MFILTGIFLSLEPYATSFLDASRAFELNLAIELNFCEVFFNAGFFKISPIL